ncbi:MAG: hypothetical protein Q9213_005608 [Squamulea squamosa]
MEEFSYESSSETVASSDAGDLDNAIDPDNTEGFLCPSALAGDEGLFGGKNSNQHVRKRYIFIIEHVSTAFRGKWMKTSDSQVMQLIAAANEDEFSDSECSSEDYADVLLWNRKIELLDRVEEAKHNLASLRPLRILLGERYEAFSLMIGKEYWAPGIVGHLKGLQEKIDKKIRIEEEFQFDFSAELREMDGFEEEPDGFEEETDGSEED